MEEWQKALGLEALTYLKKTGLITDEKVWQDRLADPTQNWLSFEMVKRVNANLMKEIGSLKVKQKNETLVGVFKASAYDLSVASCGKNLDDPLYGLTASGFSLRGLSRLGAMCIATDKKYAFGTSFRLEFESPFDKINGIYTIRDRGGSITENKLDIFFGDFGKAERSTDAMDFGVRDCKVYMIED
jgi:3D (Asp-Asp-Asp) domain-containing protein